jgi:hypothetical protein
MNSTGALSELVEAAVRSGQPDRAAAACERLSAIAAASGADWARGAAALARALLADGAVVDEIYREAIELLSHTRMATFLARARLCYGEWLRRNGRRAEAGTQLRAAFDAFAAMGANAFAERARLELEATGAKVRTHRQQRLRVAMAIAHQQPPSSSSQAPRIYCGNTTPSVALRGSHCYLPGRCDAPMPWPPV